MIKYISFDLDGTLADDKFDSLIWDVELPKLYSEKHGIDIEAAKTKVYAEYYKAKYIDRITNWTDLKYWFRRFKLNNWKKLFNDLSGKLACYNDTREVLEYLSKRYRLVLFTAADKQFIDLKLDSGKLRKYFYKIYSAPNDFGSLSKSRKAYLSMLKRLRARPEELIHIGDDHAWDYEVPMSVGISSYYLDRTKKSKGERVIHSLIELGKVL